MEFTSHNFFEFLGSAYCLSRISDERIATSVRSDGCRKGGSVMPAARETMPADRSDPAFSSSHAEPSSSHAGPLPGPQWWAAVKAEASARAAARSSGGRTDAASWADWRDWLAAVPAG